MSDPEHTQPPADVGCCGHNHAPGAGPLPESSDPGSKSLAEALRVSFILLAVIMALMVVGFLLTGVQSIASNEVGIVKVFGRVVRTAQPGLTYNWPFPIGQIEIVKTDEQRMTIHDFWFNEMPEDVEKSLSEITPAEDGLRPGWDGALLTGDRYLIHVKIDCLYVVEDPKAFIRWVRDPYPTPIPGSEKPMEIDPKTEIIRSAVCRAGIFAAATQTAFGLQTGGKADFESQVKRLGNAILRGEAARSGERARPADPTGLAITKVEVTKITWPLRARADYEAVQQAVITADRRMYAARSEAERVLRVAAGPGYEKLVGKPWDKAEPDKGPQAKRKDANLIGRYRALRAKARGARTDGESAEADRLEAQAETVLKRIDEVLLSGDIKGEASRIIAQARAYETRIKQRVQARAVEFERLLPEYKKAPAFTIARLWAVAREEILAAAAEKYYVSTDQGKLIVKINRDPSLVRKQLLKKLVEAAKAREEKQK